jgi:glycosyltransferase involved in cell wall biosynthesis
LSQTKPTFSVITPTLDRTENRQAQLLRAINSIKQQTYPHWEHVIVDDGSSYSVEDFVKENHAKNKYTVVTHPYQMERVISFNDGMKAAKNDWFVFLDDDDEYMPMYLEYVADAIMRNPEYRVFNYGGLVTNKKEGWIRVRHPIQFEEKLECAMETGQIVNGQFCFHKECLKKTGYYPETLNPYDFADLMQIPGYGSGIRELGNPWGQDFGIMYKLTRHYITKCLDLYLYVTHIRGTE